MSEQGDVRGADRRFTLESAFGSVRPSTSDLDAIIRAAKDEKAERTISEMREG